MMMNVSEMKLLPDGWLDGEGMAPNHEGLDWLTAMFDKYFSDNPPHAIYPTVEGNVYAEWWLEPRDISLEIDLTTHQGSWHDLDLETGDESAYTIDLDNAAECILHNNKISSMIVVPTDS